MFDFVFEFDRHVTRGSVRLHALSDAGKLLSAAFGGARKVCLITDEHVGALYGETVQSSVAAAGFEVVTLSIPAGESSKSLGRATALYSYMADHQIGRDGIVLALGGGVVSDLSGFVAGTWMRGVEFVIAPTTLEAAIDACLGGKTGVDLPQGKNLVGVFHQPSLIIVDPACLNTLDDRDLRAGLAESIKHALIVDSAFLDWHEKHVDAIRRREPDVLQELILRNLWIKGEIVQRDPYERAGERVLLNFGHTIGHAVERACDFKLRHGECVALGMVAACRLGGKLGVTGSATTNRVVKLLERFDLPTKTDAPTSLSRVLECLQMDKKIEAGHLRFVLLEDVGRPTIRSGVPADVVREAITTVISD